MTIFMTLFSAVLLFVIAPLRDVTIIGRTGDIMFGITAMMFALNAYVMLAELVWRMMGKCAR